MKPRKIHARSSSQLLASSLLLPLLALWCCGQLWGSRRVLLGMMLLIMTGTIVMAVWLMLRMVAWCGSRARGLYLRTLLLMVRRSLPLGAPAPGERCAGRHVAGSAPRDDERPLGTSLV